MGMETSARRLATRLHLEAFNTVPSLSIVANVRSPKMSAVLDTGAERWLSVRATADRLGIPLRTMRSWVALVKMLHFFHLKPAIPNAKIVVDSTVYAPDLPPSPWPF